jgi:tetratricopeptide (TPR) repeat protein
MRFGHKFSFLSVGFLAVLLPTSYPSAPQSPTSSDGEATSKKASENYDAGMRLLREKRYAEALEQFRLEEQHAPNLPQGATGEGIALALLGRLDEADNALNRALQLDPSDWMARRELGIVEWELNHKEEAAKQFSEIVKLFPSDGPINSLLGQYEYEKHNYQQAAVFFAVAPAELVRNPPLKLMAAEALLKSGRLEEGKQQLAGLEDAPGLTPDQRFRLGWLLGQSRQYKDAIAVFNSLPADYPDQLKVSYGLALAYLELDDFSKSIALLKPHAASPKTSPAVLSLLGVAEEKAGRTEEAYNDFRRGIELFPSDDECYLDIAALAAVHVDYDLALPFVSAGIETIPSNYKLILTRGLLYNLKGQYDLALRDYQNALSLAPEQASIYVASAMCYEAQNRYPEAVSILQQAARLQIKDVLVYYFLADALFRQGIAPNTPRYEQAQSAVESGLRLDPEYAFTYLQRAKLELMAQHTENAVLDLEHARRLEPNSQAILYQLANAYRREGRNSEADKLLVSTVEANKKEGEEERVRALEGIMLNISSKKVGEP